MPADERTLKSENFFLPLGKFFITFLVGARSRQGLHSLSAHKKRHHSLSYLAEARQGGMKKGGKSLRMHIQNSVMVYCISSTLNMEIKAVYGKRTRVQVLGGLKEKAHAMMKPNVTKNMGEITRKSFFQRLATQ